MNPLLSVIVHGWRGGLALTATLDSLLGQTLPAVEILVAVDPAVQAEADVILKLYGPAVRSIPCGGSRTAAAFNRAIGELSGRHLAFLRAGAQWPANAAAALTARLEQQPFCDALAIDRALPAGSERVVTLIDLIAVASELDLATAVFRRDAVIAAGMFDEGIRERFDVDLYLRLAWRRHGIVCCAAPRGATLAAAHAAGDGRVRDLEAVASVLERFAHRHPLDATTRTALRVRNMTLIDRLEIEQAKCRMAEGHADAARFHLASARWPSWRVRLAIALLRLMPRFATTLYQHLPGATSLL